VTVLPGPDVWSNWLRGLESEAARLDQEPSDGTQLDVSLDPPPVGALPDDLMDRARVVLVRLEAVTSIIEQRRDDLAGELSRLARPRPRASCYASWDSGAALDVNG